MAFLHNAVVFLFWLMLLELLVSACIIAFVGILAVIVYFIDGLSARANIK